MFPAFNLPPLPAEHQGLEETTAQLKRSERKFVHINNNLGINMFKASVQDAVHKKENLVVSLVSATTSLAMIFLGARGVTSWQINELLRYTEFYTPRYPPPPGGYLWVYFIRGRKFSHRLIFFQIR